MPPQHFLWIEIIFRIIFWDIDHLFGIFKKKWFLFLQSLHREELHNFAGEKGMMVGERIRKEPVGEVEKWKGRENVWKQLEKGGITKYIEKLHGYDTEVTNNMVKMWKDGKVKVNGTYFHIIER